MMPDNRLIFEQKVEVSVAEAEQPDQQDEDKAEDGAGKIAEKRVRKREFLARVAAEAELPLRTVNLVYDTLLDELLETMRRGEALMLTGFGKFYPQAHKGHRVRLFKEQDGKAIDDYFVLKFSATRSVNRSLLEAPREERAEIGALFAGEDVEEIDESEFEPEAKPRKSRAKADKSLLNAAEATRSQRASKRAQATADREESSEPEQKRAV
jgi:nucleoid DNA-binding protein